MFNKFYFRQQRKQWPNRTGTTDGVRFQDQVTTCTNYHILVLTFPVLFLLLSSNLCLCTKAKFASQIHCPFEFFMGLFVDNSVNSTFCDNSTFLQLSWPSWWTLVMSETHSGCQWISASFHLHQFNSSAPFWSKLIYAVIHNLAYSQMYMYMAIYCLLVIHVYINTHRICQQKTIVVH